MDSADRNERILSETIASVAIDEGPVRTVSRRGSAEATAELDDERLARIFQPEESDRASAKAKVAP